MKNVKGVRNGNSLRAQMLTEGNFTSPFQFELVTIATGPNVDLISRIFEVIGEHVAFL